MPSTRVSSEVHSVSLRAALGPKNCSMKRPGANGPTINLRYPRKPKRNQNSPTSKVARRHRNVVLRFSGSRPGRIAKVATIMAYSWRQASIPAIPSAASPAERLRTPWTAHSTNGAAICSSRKSFPTKGQNRGVRGTRNVAESATACDRDSAHQRVSRGNDPPENDVLDHE